MKVLCTCLLIIASSNVWSSSVYCRAIISIEDSSSLNGYNTVESKGIELDKNNSKMSFSSQGYVVEATFFPATNDLPQRLSGSISFGPASSYADVYNQNNLLHNLKHGNNSAALLCE